MVLGFGRPRKQWYSCCEETYLQGWETENCIIDILKHSTILRILGDLNKTENEVEGVDDVTLPQLGDVFHPAPHVENKGDQQVQQQDFTALLQLPEFRN